MGSALYHDENTLFKVRSALKSVDVPDGKIDLAIVRMQNDGILFSERLKLQHGGTPKEESHATFDDEAETRICVGITTACKDREEVERVLEHYARTSSILASVGIYSNIDIFPYQNIHHLP